MHKQFYHCERKMWRVEFNSFRNAINSCTHRKFFFFLCGNIYKRFEIDQSHLTERQTYISCITTQCCGMLYAAASLYGQCAIKMPRKNIFTSIGSVGVCSRTPAIHHWHRRQISFLVYWGAKKHLERAKPKRNDFIRELCVWETGRRKRRKNSIDWERQNVPELESVCTTIPFNAHWNSFLLCPFPTLHDHSLPLSFCLSSSADLFFVE